MSRLRKLVSLSGHCAISGAFLIAVAIALGVAVKSVADEWTGCESCTTTSDPELNDCGMACEAHSGTACGAAFTHWDASIITATMCVASQDKDCFEITQGVQCAWLRRYAGPYTCANEIPNCTDTKFTWTCSDTRVGCAE